MASKKWDEFYKEYKKVYGTDFDSNVGLKKKVNGTAQDDYNFANLKNLYDTAQAEDTATSNLAKTTAEIEANKIATLKNEGAQFEVYKKYLPNYLETQGLADTGNADTIAINARNSYLNRVNDINNNAFKDTQTAKTSYQDYIKQLYANSQNNANDLTDKYKAQLATEQANKDKSILTTAYEILSAIELGTKDQSYFDKFYEEYEGKMSDDLKSQLTPYTSLFKNAAKKNTTVEYEKAKEDYIKGKETELGELSHADKARLAKDYDNKQNGTDNSKTDSGKTSVFGGLIDKLSKIAEEYKKNNGNDTTETATTPTITATEKAINAVPDGSYYVLNNVLYRKVNGKSAKMSTTNISPIQLRKIYQNAKVIE